MKALSVRPPWSVLICPPAHLYARNRYLPKNVENRTWTTDYIGDLIIHSSRAYDVGAMDINPMAFINGMTASEYPRGYLIGIVHLDYVGLEVQSPWHQEGYYGWYMSNPRPFKNPIPYLGQLSIFEIPDDVIANAF